MPPDREPVVLALSPAARVGMALVALVLVGMLAVLIAVLVSLEGTRSEIRTTREGVVETEARLQRVTAQLAPLLAATAPLVGDGAQRRLRRRTATLADSIDVLPELADKARDGVDAATFIATTLGDSGLARTLTTVRSLADDLGRPGASSVTVCDERLRTRPPAAAGQLGCLLRTVPNIRALLRSQRRLNRISTSTQLRQLSVTRRTFDLLSESLAIQREILERARSVDRKTGGPAPAAPLGPTGPGTDLPGVPRRGQG